LIDAGADLDEVRAMCQRVPVSGWGLEAEAVMRNGIAATHINVLAEATTVVRTAAHITGLLHEARLPDRVRVRSLAVFGALAQAEGKLHNRPPEQVHFHEVGALDAIVDVVGTCAALELLDIDEVHASPVAHGIGMIRSAHGALPNPPPAVIELLRDAPVYGLDIPLELTTPTGAAILSALAVGFGPMPPMAIEASGFGAGTAELDDRPNMTQVILGTQVAEMVPGQPVQLLEVNVDDATGETLAHTVSALLNAGAHDAWITPVIMKKGRPGHTVSVLADAAVAAQVAATLTRETGSMGVRGQVLQRWPQARLFDEVAVEGLPVRVKVSAGRVKVEHDDAARAAKHLGRPVRDVVSIAEAEWRARSGQVTGPEAVPDFEGDPSGHDLGGHAHEHGHIHADDPDDDAS